MAAMLRSYNGDQDFMRIRDFLIDTYALNRTIDRWEFVRYFVLPCHSYHNMRHFGVPTRSDRPFRDELPFWEKTIGVWENEDGNIVGVVNSENEEPGEAWIQIHPDYTVLYDEMITYIEAHLADRVDNIGYVKLYIYEDSDLEEIARARGYRKLEDGATESEYIIEELSVPQLPEGFVIFSVLDEDDVDKRRIAYSFAFGANYSWIKYFPV